MALNNLGLGFVFTAQDLATPTMLKIGGKFGQFDTRVTQGSKNVGLGFNQIALGAQALQPALDGIISSVIALADAAGSFEQGLAAVGAVTKATADEMILLEESAIAAGLATQFSPQEAVDGLLNLATAGQTATQATETLIPVLDLAAGSLGQLGVGEAAAAVVGTLNAYSLEAGKATEVTDKLLRITQLTNFQAQDFEIALSKAAATGATFGQSMDEVLTVVGLLRNANIDASSSATAFREATRRLGADARVQAEVTRLGVKIFDEQTGVMLPLTQIIADFGDKTQELGEKERNNAVAFAFGARGLLAFNAVLGATRTVMIDGTAVTLKGAEAVNDLQKELSNAEGTAAQFKDTLLDTFEGQKTLLTGTVETLLAVVGKPIIQALTPALERLREITLSVMNVFNDIPEGIKEGLGKALVVVAGIAALASGLIGAGAIVAGLALAAKIAVAGFALMATAAVPVLAAVALLSAAAAGLLVVWEKDLGGLRTFVNDIVDDITLAWDGLVQLFTDGGFSGAVDEELQKTENEGLREFIIDLFQFALRVERFWEGLVEGFKAGLAALEPTFTRLQNAFTKLGDALHDLFGVMLQDATNLPSDEYTSFGATVGGVLAKIIGFMTGVITIGVEMVAGFIRGITKMKTFLKATFGVLIKIFSAIFEAFEELAIAFGIMDENTGESTTGWEILGTVIAVVASIIGAFLLTTFGPFLAAVFVATELITALVGVITGDFEPGLNITTVALVALFSPFLLLVGAIKAVIFVIENIGEWLEKLGGWLTGVGEAISSWAKDALNEINAVAAALADEVFGEDTISFTKLAIQDLTTVITGGLTEQSEETVAATQTRREELAAELLGGDFDTTSSLTGAARIDTTALEAKIGELVELARTRQESGVNFIIQMDTEKVGELLERSAGDAVSRGANSVSSF